MSSLSDIMKEVSKKFSKDNSDIVYDPKKQIERISSGCYTFDLVSGGGFPRKRLTEVFGMESSGKTSLIYATLAKLQKEKKVGVLIDFEQTWDPIYAQIAFGLVHDGKYFCLFQPDNIEQGGAIIEIIERIDNVDCIVCDSIVAMKTQAMIDCSLDKERKIGAHAKAIGEFIDKAKPLAKNKNAAFIFTNQMRVNINTSKFEQNVGTGAGFNPMEKHVTPGGYSVRFFCSLRMKLEYGGRQELENSADAITGESTKVRNGHVIKVINIKSKIGTPFLKGKTYFDFMTPEQKGGWREDKDIINILKKRGRITQKGTKFIYEGLKKNWENTGSKLSSEQKFSENVELMKDAKALVESLMTKISILDKATEDEVGLKEIAEQNNSISEIQEVTL
jgi:recombination protein RecA